MCVCVQVYCYLAARARRLFAVVDMYVKAMTDTRTRRWVMTYIIIIPPLMEQCTTENT